MQMFKEMGFVKHFHIPPENLYRFILRAQEGYRNIPYHNWDHGFAVLHFTYAVLKSCNHTQNNCFTLLEGLALLTAAMCHDLDHPGTTSQYQEAINSDIAQKYRGLGSILERHHIEKTLSIFEHPGTNFIAQLSETEHKEFIDLVRRIILATDLKKHFQVLLEEQTMASEGYNRTNARHRELLRSVVISSADLSDLTKGRRTVRKSAKLVNMEFFDQGDKEKAMGLLPLKMMDRTHTNIAEEQAKFISKVVMPVYRVLAALCPEVQGCINKLENNLQFWQNAMSYFEEQSNRNRSQLEILEDVELDKISLFRKNKD
ncbi:cGMP-dependent 3',5'-cyclic phosphodiesterase-like isoform X2 [Macrosteles quadrilineatus]|nr:cGMP-dependent 3',5'-cyclic phosphodiesterase-like isoform X2 [Macrosteles quadrilineatus]